MPVIKIDYDDKQWNKETILKLACELQHIMAEASKLELDRVSIFASANHITINAAPMEIYIQAGAPSIPRGDMQKMLNIIAERLKDYKKANDIKIPINLSLVRMDWKYKLCI